MFSSLVSINAAGSILLVAPPRNPTSNVRNREILTIWEFSMGYGKRHCRPGGNVLVYLPKRVTTATCPSRTVMKPVASHSTTMIRITMATSLGEPLGMDICPPPLPPPPKLPPRRGLRPKNAPSRLLKSRQTSSRSGGPSPLLGRRGGSDPLSLLLLPRSEEHTSELQSLMRISYAVFCLKTKHK